LNPNANLARLANTILQMLNQLVQRVVLASTTMKQGKQPNHIVNLARLVHTTLKLPDQFVYTVELANTIIYQVKPPKKIVNYVELASTTTKQEELPHPIVKHVTLVDIILK